jgi:hypothetical protein
MGWVGDVTLGGKEFHLHFSPLSLSIILTANVLAVSSSEYLR